MQNGFSNGVQKGFSKDRKGKSKKGKGKSKGFNSGPTAAQRPYKPMPPSQRPCLKCGRRDHETKDCPDKERPAASSHFVQHLTFGAWCLGNRTAPDDAGADEESFNLEKIEAGKALLDCGATDTIGSVEAVEAIIDRAQRMFGNDEECVSVDTQDRPVYKFGDAKKQKVLSKVTVRVKPGGEKSGNLQVHAHEAKGVPVLLSSKSLASLGAIVNFATGQAVMQNLNSQKVVQMERSDTGHLWFDLFDEMPTVSNDPYDLIDLGRRD